MARLRAGEQENRQNFILRLLKGSRWGIKESEVAQEMGVNRRTANNYLRKLEKDDKAEKDGRLWFSKR